MTDMTEDAQENPAARADGKSLAELFASDPMELTAEERGIIIKRFQQQRSQFMQEEKNKGTKQKKGDAAKSAAKDIDIDVDDIEI